MQTRVAVVYYSSTGNVHRMAEAVAEGAESTGAEVRVRRVRELAPPEAISSNPQWQAHLEAVRDRVPEASLDDLEWADGYAFGTPTRFGNVAAQLKQFLDSAGGLWQAGSLADKPVTTFTSAINVHGGQESTILALNNVFYHWGCVLVPPGYTSDAVYGAGGNPYGTSHTTGMDNDRPGEGTLASLRYQGERLARFAAHLTAMRQPA